MEESERKHISVPTEFENVIQSIEIQLEVTKEEHNNLRKELLQLIAENQQLTSQLDFEYRERLKSSEEEKFSEVFKSDIVLNLQNQLDLSKREKEKTLDLYKASLKLIEKLEEENSSQKEKLFEGSQKGVSSSSPIVTLLEAKLKNVREHLEISMTDREKLESENVKHQTEIAKLKLNLESNNKIIDQLKSREEDWKNKFTKSEQEYTLLNATFECVTNSRNELEKKLEIYERKIQDLVQRNNESRRKVEEALDVVEKALTEKESAGLRELHLQEEVNKLHLCLEHVIEEAGKKVGAELEDSRKKYESGLKEVATELSRVKSELERKKTEHKRILLKYKKLEKLTSARLDKEKISLIKGSETEIILLENHLDSVYQELERFKVKYEESEMEKRKLEEEVSELMRKQQILIKEKEAKETLLGETIRELQLRIERKVEDLNEASRRGEFFLGQVRDLQEENRNLTGLADNCNCQKLREKLKKLNEIRISQKNQLESHVESQMKLNETWKNEIREAAEKFEGRIREVKKECHRLKARNKKILKELNAAKKKIAVLEKV